MPLIVDSIPLISTDRFPMYGSMDRVNGEEHEEYEDVEHGNPNIGGILFFGCRWRVATDDFVFPSWIEFISRIIGLFIIISLYVSEYNDIYIQYYEMDDYLIGYGVICLLVSFNLMFLGLNSMQGHIWDERRYVRVLVIPLLYTNIVFVVGEVIWLILGTHKVSRAWNNVDSIPVTEMENTLVTVTLVVIVFSWVGVCSKLLLSFIFFKKINQFHTLSKYLYNQFSTARTFRIIGDVISFFFHDPDFVPTDTAAALFLLDLYKKRYPVAEGSNVDMSIPKGFNFSEIAHYMNYSSSIYGFLHLLLLKKTRSFLKILGKGICCCCNRESDRVESEGPCCSHFDIFTLINELPSLDYDSFFFVNLHNRISFTPFMVIIDKEKEKIVISIRGSMTMNDAITDLLIDTTAIDGYEQYYTHTGMMEAARNIYKELQDKDILNKALALNPGYGIVVTGHSLGAGVAVILTFLLRILYKSTICYAFACPVCLNERARLESERFVINVVNGDDVFPRLSPTNFALLVTQMRHVLRYSRVPKYKILGLRIFSCLFRRDISLEDTLLVSSDSGTSLPNKMLINKYNRKHSIVLDISLRLPGRILHFTKTENDYFVRQVEHTYFSHIEISTRMTMDHLPINLLKAIEAIKLRSESSS
ncbi:diacylglycerol lipase-beta [Lepeophtheirus salmonis]|uniref:diacylglycerol lipase-beta n=1 Tax=Lepeophtheirus salmonis TaxID=72036 RepID=UPI001AE84BCA|nr:diacylglycerol lipase-beta-like [Lepeophtheirus salmonis]XP_040576360.1 diacylglycerol lipase-beta-like [Lepeophtheirus salmonis]XP_040576361.1 diacylglycerol lipase-beta-like [Lepeophtheirus salmonis]